MDEAIKPMQGLAEFLRGEANGAKGIAQTILKQWADEVEAATTTPVQAERVPLTDGKELWLWRHHDHFLAFQHLYPCFAPGGDPMTLGNPFGRAVFKISHDRARS